MYHSIVDFRDIQLNKFSQTIELLKRAADDGITCLVATPPVDTVCHLKNDELIIKHLVNKINDKLIQDGVLLSVHEGAVIKYDNDLANYESLPFVGGSKYIMIKFHENIIPVNAINVFFELQLRGYIPIIVDVEFIEDLSVLPNMIKKGSLVHVGASSILGMNGRKLRRRAVGLCRNNIAHLISSSAGGVEKSSILLQAYNYLERLTPFGRVKYYKQNAERISKGVDIHALLHSP